MNMSEKQLELDAATTKQELYTLAGLLNNHPACIHSDQVTCLAYFDSIEYCKAHVQRMIDSINAYVEPVRKSKRNKKAV